MSSSKTLWVNWTKHRTKYSKKQRFIYLSFKDKIYRLKNTLKIFLEKINFYSWNKTYTLKLIDILWNSLIICLIIVFWKQGSAYFKGLSITLFFIILNSYLKDLKNLFRKEK